MILATTDRLVLRDLTLNDAEDLFLLNSDPEVLRYTGDKPFANVEAARTWIMDLAASMPHGIGRWVIERKDGSFIGRCSLRRDASGETQMGYRLLRGHWDKGYGTEAVRALISLGFDRFTLPYIVIKVARGNAASIRILEKCGALLWKEGPAERISDALIYRIDRRSFLAIKRTKDGHG